MSGYLFSLRAVILDDMGMLKKCIEDSKNIYTLNKQRSLAVNLHAEHFAALNGNVQAVKMIRNAVNPGMLKENQKKVFKTNMKPAKRAKRTRCSLKVVGTGVYNYRYVRQCQ